MNTAYEHRLLSGMIRFFLLAVAAVGITPSPTMGQAQVPSPQQTPVALAQEDHPTAQPTPIRELVEEVERNNPEIAAALHGWQAATNVPKQVSALPETQVSVQQFSVGSPRPFAGFSYSDFAYIGFGASQDLPFPGKRALRGKVADLEASSMREDSEAVRRRVIEQLKLTYLQLAYFQQTLDTLERSDQLLNQVQQVVESRYRVGQGNQQDVLRAQLQHTKILQDIAMYHQEEGKLEAQLKQFLNRAQTSPAIVAEPLTPTFLLYTDAQLLQRLQGQNPDVRAKQQLAYRGEKQVELAHKDFRPDFMAEYTYQHGSAHADYYMATFGIRLPNRGRQKAELSEAVANQERAKSELQAEMQRVASEVEQQYVLVRSSEDRLNNYKGGLIPQADATFRAGMAAYQANRQDFETLLANFLDVLNLDLEYRRELVEHESALSRLERLTGVTLP